MGINLGELVVKLKLDFAEWQPGLDKAAYNVGQAARKIEREFKSIANSVSFVSGTLGLFGTQGLAVSQTFLMMGRAAATATKSIAGISGPLALFAGPLAGIGVGALSAAAGLTAIGVAAINAAARTQQLAMATGLHASTLAALTPLAKAYGVDQDYLARAMERMEKNALAAAKSGHLMSNGFTDLGINARQFVQLPIEQKLVILAAKFQALGHEGHKTAIAIEIFGRAGAAMVPVLEMGPKKMQAWIDYAKRTGAAMGDEAYAGALKLKEETAKLGLIWVGVTNQLVTGLLPALTDITTAFAAGTEKGTAFELVAKGIGRLMRDLAEVVYMTAFAFQWWTLKVEQADLAVKKWQASSSIGKVVSNVADNLTFLATAGIMGKFVSPFADRGGQEETASLDAQENLRRHKELQLNLQRQQQQNALRGESPTDAFGLLRKGGGKEPPNKEFDTAMERMKSELDRLANAAQKARDEGLSLGEAFGPKIWAEATAATAAFIANLKAQFGNIPGMKEVIAKLDVSKIFSAELAEKIQAASKMTIVNAEKEVKAIREQVAALREKNAADQIGGALAKAAVGAPGRVSVVRESVKDLQSAYEEAIKRGTSTEKDQTQENLRRGYVELAQVIKLSGDLSAVQVDEFVEGEIRKVSALQRTKEAIESIQDLLGKGPKEGLGPEAQAELDKKRAALKPDQRAALAQQEALHNVTERGQRFDIEAKHAAAALALADFHEEMRQKDISFAEDNAGAIKKQALFQHGLDIQRKQFEINNQELFQKDQELTQERELIKLWDEKAIRSGTFGQKTRAIFNDLKLEGDKLGEVIANAFKTGIEGWENSLAHFIVTGQGTLKQVFVQFEETIVKGVIAKGIGTIAGTIGKHIPGPIGETLQKMGIGKADGSSAAQALWVQTAGGFGGMGAGAPGSIGGAIENAKVTLSRGGGEAGGGLFGGGAKGGILSTILGGGIGAALGGLFGGGKGAAIGGGIGLGGGILQNIFGKKGGTLGKIFGGGGTSTTGVDKNTIGPGPQKKGLLGSILGFAAPFLALIPGVGPFLSMAAGMASGAMGGGGGVSLGSILGKGGGGGGGGAFPGGIWAGDYDFMEAGGDVWPERDYIVGEKRAELFRPTRPGRISSKLDEKTFMPEKKSSGFFGGLAKILGLGLTFSPLAGIISAASGKGFMKGFLGPVWGKWFGDDEKKDKKDKTGIDPTTIGPIGKVLGGDVTPGRSYMVGEQRAEMFTPDRPGRISATVPRNLGGGVNNAYHFAPVINAIDSDGVAAMLEEHGAKFIDHMDSHARKSNWRDRPEL